MRRCIFCHQPLAGQKSREHVLPQWLDDELGGNLVYYGHGIRGDTSSEFTVTGGDRVIGTGRTRVEGRVCSSCNNNWLNDFEVTARPIVSDLVFGRTDARALSSGERDLLASWLFKTLLVAVSSGSGEYGIHACDYHNFRATGRPGEWLNIYVASLETNCKYSCGPVELNWHFDGTNESGSVNELGLKYVFHIGALHVVACHTALSGATQKVVQELHNPIWSPQAYTGAPGTLDPELRSDSLALLLAYGLLPSLLVDDGFDSRVSRTKVST